MEWWHWVLIAVGILLLLAVIFRGSIAFLVWRIWRSKNLVEVPPMPYAAARPQQGGKKQKQQEERLLQQAEGIAAHFAGLPGAATLGVEIPRPEIVVDQQRVAGFDALAQQMSQAERTAEIQARVSVALVAAAESITSARDRTLDAHERAVENLTRAYSTLGLVPPLMRTEEEVAVASRRLQGEMDRLRALI